MVLFFWCSLSGWLLVENGAKEVASRRVKNALVWLQCKAAEGSSKTKQTLMRSRNRAAGEVKFSTVYNNTTSIYGYDCTFSILFIILHPTRV